MKKAIIIISITLTLVIVGVFLINPLIKKYQEQTIISDGEFCTEIDLPNNMNIIRGYSVCKSQESNILGVKIIADLSQEEYEFIKEQVVEEEEWHIHLTEKAVIDFVELNLRKNDWQGEKYEFFHNVETSEVNNHFLHKNIIAMYKKSTGKYRLYLIASSDFFEKRNIELNIET